MRILLIGQSASLDGLLNPRPAELAQSLVRPRTGALALSEQRLAFSSRVSNYV
jgi:hypothetical protein